MANGVPLLLFRLPYSLPPCLLLPLYSSQDQSVAEGLRGKYLAFVPQLASAQGPGTLTAGLTHLASLREVC